MIEETQDSMAEEPVVTVFLISEWFYPDMTGAVRRLFRNAVLLREKGIRFVAITERLSHHGEGRLTVDGVQIKRVTVSEINSPYADVKATLVKEARLLWREMGQPNSCIHIISSSSWNCAKELAAARWEGLPSLCGLTMMPEVPGGRWLQWRERVGTSLRCLPFKAILALSQEMGREYTGRYFWMRRKLGVIPNGVDTERFRRLEPCEKTRFRHCLELRTEDPLVLYVGSLVPRKRLRLIVNAWEKVLESFPSAKLVVVGVQKQRLTQSKEKEVDFGKEFRDIIKAMEEFERNGSIILFDEVENPEIYFQVADLYVLPSQLEGLPNTLIEALSCGLPSLVSDFVGRPMNGEEIGNEGEHFVRCVRNDDDWGEAIIEGLAEKEKGGEIGERARNLIEEVHSLDVIISRLADLYCRIAPEPPGIRVPEWNGEGSR